MERYLFAMRRASGLIRSLVVQPDLRTDTALVQPLRAL